MLSFSLRLLRPWELGWGQYLWLQVIVVSYHKLMHQKSVWKKPHGRGVLISLRTLWLLLAEEYDSFLKQAAPWEEKKKRLYGEMPESFTMPERLTAVLSTPGVCVILRKHKCITSLEGQDESFSIINSICLLSGLRQRRRPWWEGDLSSCAGGGTLKNLGMLGWRKRTWWELQYWIFGNSRAVMRKREQIWSW